MMMMRVMVGMMLMLVMMMRVMVVMRVIMLMMVTMAVWCGRDGVDHEHDHDNPVKAFTQMGVIKRESRLTQ